MREKKYTTPWTVRTSQKRSTEYLLNRKLSKACITFKKFLIPQQHSFPFSCIPSRTAEMQFKIKLCNRKGRLFP